jgi:putative ABC transport system permease protein
MFSVYTTLSRRYLRRRWVRASLIVLSIAAGVSMLVATRALNRTMDRAAAAAASPLAAVADLIVSNGDAPVDRWLAVELLKVEGVLAAHPRIFAKVHLPNLNNRPALLIGLDLAAEQNDKTPPRWQVHYDQNTLSVAWARFAARKVPAVLGKDLEDALAGTSRDLRVRAPGSRAVYALRRAGTVTGKGPAAALGGDVVILKLDDNPARIVGLKKWQVSRIDLTLRPGADRAAVQKRVAAVLAGRAEVRTPEEQNQAVQNVMTSLQVALLLCGVAALVVGLFLVYNALAVSVAERRHEVGILRGLGATRGQVLTLFTGEAALLGLAGSLLGIPLGLAIARVSLEPMREVLSKLFFAMDATGIEVGTDLIVLGVAAGVATAVAAALLPALLASRERPADAVRRIPPRPTWRHRFTQVAACGLLLAAGAVCITRRDQLPPRVGMYGGLGLVVVSTLLATPLLSAVLARLLLPLARGCLGVTGRLAADNLVRAPGRTGLVIAALAAGVGLVTETAGVIRSNRVALRDWVQQAIPADLVITAGSPVSAGGQSLPLTEALGAQIRKMAGVEAVLPSRVRRQLFRDTQILMVAVNASEVYRATASRPRIKTAERYRALNERPDGAIISENFAILHGVKVGDTLALASPNGPVALHVVGQFVDYSWNHGSIIVNRALYLKHWEDPRVDLYDVYLTPGVGSRAVHNLQESILKAYGAEHGLFVLRQDELQGHIDETIEQLYGIALGQQIAVMFVAGLGAVTALLISVVQRQRELGLLRALGASRGQVIRSVLAEALLMGVLGTLIGLVVGVPLQWYALRVVMVEETGYLFPVYIPWAAALWIAAASAGMATLAGLGPALHVIRQRIPEAIALE